MFMRWGKVGGTGRLAGRKTGRTSENHAAAYLLELLERTAVQGVGNGNGAIITNGVAAEAVWLHGV